MSKELEKENIVSSVTIQKYRPVLMIKNADEKFEKVDYKDIVTRRCDLIKAEVKAEVLKMASKNIGINGNTSTLDVFLL